MSSPLNRSLNRIYFISKIDGKLLVLALCMNCACRAQNALVAMNVLAVAPRQSYDEVPGGVWRDTYIPVVYMSIAESPKIPINYTSSLSDPVVEGELT